MFGEPRNPIEKEICDLEKSMVETRDKIKELRVKLPEEKVQDYELFDLNGQKMKLSDLFADHDELLLVHNMGPQCPYCTLWADGFRTMKPYFESRCAFVLETDIAPDELGDFAGKKIHADYTFVFKPEDNGEILILAHHSSLEVLSGPNK